MKFTEHLARLDPLNATIAKPTAVPKMAELIEPRFVSLNGRGVGVLDEVAAQLMLQGIASTRLLVAINDQLLEAALALRKNDPAPLKQFLVDLNTVLDTTGEHIKKSFDAVEKAQDTHERVLLRNPGAKS